MSSTRIYITAFHYKSQKMQVRLEIATFCSIERRFYLNDILPIVEQIYEKGEALLIVAETLKVMQGTFWS